MINTNIGISSRIRLALFEDQVIITFQIGSINRVVHYIVSSLHAVNLHYSSVTIKKLRGNYRLEINWMSHKSRVTFKNYAEDDWICVKINKLRELEFVIEDSRGI